MTPQECFAEYNARYFGGRLPKRTKVHFSTRISGLLGEFRLMPRWERTKGRSGALVIVSEMPAIRLCAGTKKSSRIWMMTLLHEMVHLKLHIKGSGHCHGYEFQREMKRLARIGAFARLW